MTSTEWHPQMYCLNMTPAPSRQCKIWIYPLHLLPMGANFNDHNWLHPNDRCAVFCMGVFTYAATFPLSHFLKPKISLLNAFSSQSLGVFIAWSLSASYQLFSLGLWLSGPMDPWIGLCIWVEEVKDWQKRGSWSPRESLIRRASM